jgi:hypothetical protein
VPIGQSSGQTQFTVGNAGEVPLTIDAVGLAGWYPNDYRVVSDNCSKTQILPSGICTVAVEFRPKEAGERSAQLEFQSNSNGGGTQHLPLSGVGVTPDVKVLPASMDFGSVNVGDASASQAVTVTNAVAVAENIGATVTAPFSVLPGTTCTGGLVDPDDTCSVTVGFKPAKTGPAQGQLTITVGGARFPVALQGLGVEPGFGVSPATKDYGDVLVGTPASQRFTVENTGDGPMSITGVSLGGDDPQEFATSDDECTGAVLPPHATCTVTASFVPSHTGAQQALLRFVDNVPGPNQTVPLQGNGIAPEVEIDLSGRAFGSQLVGTNGPNQTFEVENVGSAPLDISGHAHGS